MKKISMIRTVFLLLVISTATLNPSVFASSAPPIIWNKTYGGSSAEIAYFAQQTSDGGYVVGGYTSSFGAGGADFWLVKTDAYGNMEWNKTFGGIGRDEAHSVRQTSDGGYIVAGYSSSFGAGLEDFWLVKTVSNGNMEWNKTFGGIGRDEAHSVRQTGDGGYVVGGYTNSYGAGGIDFWLVKTNAYGNKIWDKTYGGIYDDIAYSVQQTSDGGYIVAGYTSSFGAGYEDFWLVKTDSNGNKIWNKTYGGADSDYAYSAQQTSDGGYILAGCKYLSDADHFDVWLVKTDSSGNMQWNQTTGGTGDDEAYSVQQTRDNGYIITASTDSFSASRDIWLIKTDSSGIIQWNEVYGGSQKEEACFAQQIMNGGYIVAGTKYSFSWNPDIWLIRIARPGDFGTVSGGYYDFDDLCDYQDLYLFRKAYVVQYHELCDFDKDLDVDYMDLYEFRKWYIII